MKKALATALAATMALSLSSVAFAGDIDVDISYGNSSSDATIEASDVGARAEFTLKKNGSDLIMYNYGDTDEVKIKLNGFNYGSYTSASSDLFVDKIRVDVTDGNVKVNYKKSDNLITIKANAGLRDFDDDDFTIDVDVELDDDESGKDFTFFIKGKVAYSNIRQVSEDEKYANRDHDDEGCMYEFDSAIDEETRIRVNEYVDVYFKGNYGTDKENLRVWTDEITEVEKYFDDVDLDYYDFRALPKFATKVKVVIDGDANAFLYEYDKKTGDLTRIDAKYESDGWAFTTKTLGCYVLAEDEYQGGNVKNDSTTKEEEPVVDSTPSKTNPGTGGIRK